MKKKVMQFVIATLLVLVLVACGQSSNEAPVSTEAPTATTAPVATEAPTPTTAPTEEVVPTATSTPTPLPIATPTPLPETDASAFYYKIENGSVRVFGLKNESLAYISVPSVIEGYPVTIIAGDWEYEMLRHIELPESITVLEVNFSACENLTTVIVKSDLLTVIKSGVFSECSSLQSIELPDSVTIIGRWAFEG